MEYFVYTGRQEGPFTVEQLQNINLRMDTPVWHTGLTEWTTAGKVTALFHLIKTEPPPFRIETPPFQAAPASEYEYQLQMEEFFPEKKRIDWTTVAWVTFSVLCLLLLIWAMN